MNGQPIPGYYFDEEKEKYFKIQSCTAAQGADFKYSVENIKKLERKERIQNISIARSNKVRKERVVRHNPNSFALTHVEREIGIKRRSAYIQHLWPDSCAFGIDSQPQQVITRRPGQQSIRVFDRDPVSRTIYVVQGSNSVKQQKVWSNNIRELDGSDEQHDLSLANPYAFYPWDEVTRTTSTVSSLQYLPATGALAVTTYGSDRPPELWLSDPERDEPVSLAKLRIENNTNIPATLNIPMLSSVSAVRRTEDYTKELYGNLGCGSQTNHLLAVTRPRQQRSSYPYRTSCHGSFQFNDVINALRNRSVGHWLFRQSSSL